MARAKPRFGLAVRDGARVTRLQTDSPDELFSLVERHVAEIVRGAGGRTVSTPLRNFEPIEQVVGRVEISKPRLHGFGRERAGVDVRGDGSTEAFVGRAARRVVELAPGEDAVAGLRRVFTGEPGRPFTPPE